MSMIFNVNDQIFVPITKFSDHIGKEADGTPVRTATAMFDHENIDAVITDQLKDLITTSELHLSVIKDDKVIWESRDFTDFDGYFFEADVNGIPGSEVKNNLAFTYYL